MLLFCHATAHTVKELQRKFTHVVAYADDVVIAIPATNSSVQDFKQL